MSIKLEAPYPGVTTITLLPNPKFNDSEGRTHSLQLNRTMAGNAYSYVKTTAERSKLVMQFLLTRAKGLEFRAFLASYFSTQIKLTDHLGSIWVGKFTSNPFDLDTSSPQESQNIQIEFEGIKI